MTGSEPVDRGFVDRGAASRARLSRVCSRLTDGDLERRVDADWTVSAVLAHVAFWDRFVVAEWEQAVAAGAEVPVRWERAHTDLVNAANTDEWHALPPREAVRLAIESAERHDTYVARLDDRYVRAAVAQGRPNLLDRSRHRNEHLETIEALVGPTG